MDTEVQKVKKVKKVKDVKVEDEAKIEAKIEAKVEDTKVEKKKRITNKEKFLKLNEQANDVQQKLNEFISELKSYDDEEPQYIKKLDNFKTYMDGFLKDITKLTRVKKPRDPDMPERFKTAFIYFKMDLAKKGEKDVKQDKWKQIKNTPEMQKYVELATKDRQRYDNEMKVYYEKNPSKKPEEKKTYPLGFEQDGKVWNGVRFIKKGGPAHTKLIEKLKELGKSEEEEEEVEEEEEEEDEEEE